jgi:NAD(P)-dependent dehydrogenase (short-subunit alcohol dehydrogenase family)
MDLRDFFKLNGKVALVVGGGLGMGECTSVNFAEAGANVAVLDIDPERAERVAERVRQLGRRSVAITANVLDVSSGSAVVDQVQSSLGGLDILATIVGQAEWTSVLNTTPDTWDLDHRRNLKYFFFFAQAVANAMVSHRTPGAITAVASVSGIQSAPAHAAYGAAKAGLINLVRSMAVELAPHNIRVNAVAPGVIATPRSKSDPVQATKMAERVANSHIPAKRLGEPENIADAILFLSSDMARFVTGQTLAVDGGFTSQFLIGPPREV